MKITFYYSDQLSDLYQLCQRIITDIENNEKQLILVTEHEIKDKIDKEMWTFSQNFFIPHLLAEDLENLNKKYTQEELKFIIDNNPIFIYEYTLFKQMDYQKLAKSSNIIFFLNDNLIPFKENIVNMIAENNKSDFIFFSKKENIEKIRLSLGGYLHNIKKFLKDIRFFMKEDKWIKIEI